MKPTTTIEFAEQPDPWGFGPTAADRSVRVEWCEPIDEPVDDVDIATADMPARAPSAAIVAQTAAAVPGPVSAPATTRMTAAAAGDGAVLRVPFHPDRVGVMALFGAVIVAQAFYIGFSLTGEASARPAGVVPRPPTVAAAPVAHVERPAAPAAPHLVAGVLKIDTGSAVARVFIDGVPAGETPLTKADVLAGDHTVRVAFITGAVIERRVTVPRGETVALLLDAPVRSVAPATPAAGWVRVHSTFEVQVFDAGQLVGSSATERIMLTPGAHDLELVNAGLGYRATVKTIVVAGKLVPLAIDTPRVPVAINAQPWAEVVVDGRVHGDTPLANLMLPIGVHEIVLRHPDLGERTETVTVRAIGANRVSADLRR
jgi:PEGA domain